MDTNELNGALEAFAAATAAGYYIEHKPGMVRLSHPSFGDGEPVTDWITYAELIDNLGGGHV